MTRPERSEALQTAVVYAPPLSPRSTRTLEMWRRWALNLCVAAYYVWFAEEHFLGWRQSGDMRGLGVVVIETVVAWLILVRRAPIETSGRVVAWIATVVAIFGPMSVRPAPGGWPIGTYLQLVGATFAIISLLTIGRSFGLVAANRGIVTAGPYGLVRHPIYLAYVVVNVGYLLENPSAWNVGVLTLATFAQVVRISCEEEVLAHDEAYVEYRRRVRYRLIPYIY